MHPKLSNVSLLEKITVNNYLKWLTQQLNFVSIQKLILRVFILGLLCCSLTACSEKPLPAVSTSDTILAFGDSLTAGYGTDKTNSYPSVLAELSARTVINAGISGETTAEGLARFNQVLDTHKPSLIILLEGGNDILKNMSLSDAKNNLSLMIHQAKTRQISVVLVGVPEKSLFSSAAPMYAELASEHNLVFVESLMADLLKSPSLKSDSVHLNAKGYKKMAQELHKVLKDNGAL